MDGENTQALQEIKSITSSPDAGTALCDHIKKQGFQSHLFSDIILTFHSKDYPLHKIILSQSHYFHSLLSGPWKENGKARIELQIDDPMVTAEGLESAFAFMYGMTPIFTADNVVSILAAGCFLGLENLCESSVQFALSDLKVDTFARYNHLAEKHCYGKFAGSVRSACWSLLCTHASRELLHHLPKLSLEVLCHLLKSDELWVLSEAERYKLAKQALIDWKLARAESTGALDDYMPRKRGKSFCSRKSSGSGQVCRNSRTRSAQKGGRSIPKDRTNKKKEGSALHLEPSSTADISKEVGDLKRLRRLWEEDAGQQLDGYKGGFEYCTELFTAGGIIFAHLEVHDILQVKRELEDANISSDVANDSIWHHVLLKDHILKLKHSPSADNSSSDNDEDEDDDMEEDDDDDEDEDDEDLSERDTSDSDRWSTDNGDDSNSSDGRGREGSSRNLKKAPNSSLVCFSSLDFDSLDDLDPKRRKTTGGFTWFAKPDVGMRLANFPPFRFGAEFVMKDKTWTPCLDSKSREVFYGGSTWNIGIVSAEARHDCIRCQLWVYQRGVYRDMRREVRYLAKLFTKTISGLRCVAGVGVRSSQRHARRIVSMLLDRDDVLEDEPLRISAVVQLVDDEGI
eukprot:c23557_g1_i1 orf=169-2049(+)